MKDADNQDVFAIGPVVNPVGHTVQCAQTRSKLVGVDAKLRMFQEVPETGWKTVTIAAGLAPSELLNRIFSDQRDVLFRAAT